MRNYAYYLHDIKGVYLEVSRDDKTGKDTLNIHLVGQDNNIHGNIGIFFDAEAKIKGNLDLTK